MLFRVVELRERCPSRSDRTQRQSVEHRGASTAMKKVSGYLMAHGTCAPVACKKMETSPKSRQLPRVAFEPAPVPPNILISLLQSLLVIRIFPSTWPSRKSTSNAWQPKSFSKHWFRISSKNSTRVTKVVYHWRDPYVSHRADNRSSAAAADAPREIGSAARLRGASREVCTRDRRHRSQAKAAGAPIPRCSPVSRKRFVQSAADRGGIGARGQHWRRTRGRRPDECRRRLTHCPGNRG
jgi:hypothetical protein